MKVSILIPVVRPDKAKRCIQNARTNAGIPLADYEIITKEDTKKIGCPKMLKSLVEQAKGDYIVFIGDDCIPQKDWLKIALIEIMMFDQNIGLVGLNDLTGRNLPCHWLASKDMLPLLDGEFFHTGYHHCYCDNELMDRCIEMGRFHYSDKAIVKHDHPSITGGMFDEFYQKAYRTDILKHDRELYKHRKLNGWKTCI